MASVTASPAKKEASDVLPHGAAKPAAQRAALADENPFPKASVVQTTADIFFSAPVKQPGFEALFDDSRAAGQRDELSAVTPPLGHIAEEALLRSSEDGSSHSKSGSAARPAVEPRVAVAPKVSAEPKVAAEPKAVVEPRAASEAPRAVAPPVGPHSPPAGMRVELGPHSPPAGMRVGELGPHSPPAGVRVGESEDAGDVSSPSGKFFRGEAETESGKFFRGDGEEESIEPVVESPGDRELDLSHEDDEPGHVVMSPEAMARRIRLRRIVGGVVAFVGVLAVAVVGKTVASSGRSSSSSSGGTSSAPTAAMTAAPAAPAPKPEAKPEVTAAPAPVPAPAETAQAKPAETGAPEPEATAEPAKVDAPAEGASDPERSAALQKETVTLLNRGKYKDAIAKAREAIAADPAQALPYLYLGSALQDTGKWKDGIEAYSECVRKATKGPVHECRQMGGRK